MPIVLAVARAAAPRYGSGMAEIVNLRLARKARQRADAATIAAENRARHGRTKAERARDSAEAERLTRTVEGARRDGAAPEAD